MGCCHSTLDDGGPLVEHFACFLQATAKKERNGASRFKFAHLGRNHRRMLLISDHGVGHLAVYRHKDRA